MSNAELAFLLFLILTVGHYAVIWSIYLEKQLVRQRLQPKRNTEIPAETGSQAALPVMCFQDELLSKKKKEKKKKLSSRPAEDLRCIGQDRTDRYSCGNMSRLDLVLALFPFPVFYGLVWFLVGLRSDLSGRTSSL